MERERREREREREREGRCNGEVRKVGGRKEREEKVVAEKMA